MKLFFLPDKILHILISSSVKRRVLIVTLGAIIFGFLPLGVLSALHLSTADLSAMKTDGYEGKAVLAAESESPNFIFNVNVPSFFRENVDVDGGLTVKGKAVFADGIDLSGSDLDLGEGRITASNITYSVSAGEGIAVTAGQTPTISNDGVISLQGQTGDLNLEAGDGISIDGMKISSNATKSDSFKTVAVSGQTSLSAGSSTDTLTFVAGTGITLTTDSTNKKLTI